MAEYEPKTCTDPDCLGEGYYPDGQICQTCFGGGSLPALGARAFGAYVKTRLDAIVAEQQAQREDLTNILTKIWNAVKP